MKKIIGRTRECERLEKCMNATTAQLVVVYGRRRVGKTYLINHYFENNLDFKITGAYGQSKKIQLRNFNDELNRRTKSNKPVPTDWIQAFNNLRDYIDTLDTEKTCIFY